MCRLCTCSAQRIGRRPAWLSQTDDNRLSHRTSQVDSHPFQRCQIVPIRNLASTMLLPDCERSGTCSKWTGAVGRVVLCTAYRMSRRRQVDDTKLPSTTTALMTTAEGGGTPAGSMRPVGWNRRCILRARQLACFRSTAASVSRYAATVRVQQPSSLDKRPRVNRDRAWAPKNEMGRVR